jgi:hypothetical protein
LLRARHGAPDRDALPDVRALARLRLARPHRRRACRSSARRLFAHRHHLIEQLGQLCQELGLGLTELAEDESWARGQSENLTQRLAEGMPVAEAFRTYGIL